MQPRKTEPPALRRIKGRRNSVVTLYDHATHQRRTITVGPADDPDTRRLYHRVIAEWEGSGRRLGPHIDRVLESRAHVRRWQFANVNTESTCQIDKSRDAFITVGEITLAYYRHVERTLSKSQLWQVKQVLRILNRLYASTEAERFGPNALRLVRQEMITNGGTRQRWCRKSINRAIQRIRSVFKWAVGHEMIPAEVHIRLTAVEPLRAGQTDAPEPPKVKPVHHDMIDAIEPFVSRQVWAMIQLQRFTGARPGEVVTMQASEIDMTGDVWVYIPANDKNAWRNDDAHRRTIYIGPKAQQVIRPFLTTTGYLFSPRQAEHERRQAMREARTAHPSTNKTRDAQRARRKPRGQLGEHYTVGSYRRAIQRGCDDAYPPPAELTAEQVKAWRKQHRWHPHQLRHTAATVIARQYGQEAAKAALGHSSSAITAAVYIERDTHEAMRIAREAG